MIDVAKWFGVRALCKSHIKPPTYLFPRNPTTPFQSVCCNDSTPTTGQQPRSLAPFGRITRLTELGPDRAAVGETLQGKKEANATITWVPCDETPSVRQLAVLCWIPKGPGWTCSSEVQRSAALHSSAVDMPTVLAPKFDPCSQKSI